MAKLETEDKQFWLSGAKLNNAKKIAPWVLLGAVVIAAGVLGGIQYKKTQELNKKLSEIKQNPQKIADDEIKQLVAKVGQLIVLPSGEQPTVATVTDPNKLKDQLFFANAKTGYKVLIYTNAKKAILYNPSEHKIVEVAPINIGNNAEANSSGQSQAAGTSVTADKSQIPINVLNASNVPGLARKVADKLKAAGYTMVTVSDAPQGPSPRTTIIYELKYSADIAEVNKVLNNQATLEAQVAASGVVITLGTDFTSD